MFGMVKSLGKSIGVMASIATAVSTICSTVAAQAVSSEKIGLWPLPTPSRLLAA